MSKLNDSFYVILEPQFSRYSDENGNRKATSFKATRLTRGRPAPKTGETAVRLNLSIDSTVFEALIPTINVELGERDLFINTEVEVTSEPDSSD